LSKEYEAERVRNVELEF